jgi:hypothetical protein
VLGHKLNITDGLTDKIIPMVTLTVEMSCYRMIFLLECSVMSLVYIDRSFLLGYSQMNFTIGIILSVTSFEKLTRHRTIWLFFIFFPTTIPSVYTIGIFLSVFIDGFSKKKNSIDKCHCNILTEKIHRCFYLYLSIF